MRKIISNTVFAVSILINNTGYSQNSISPSIPLSPAYIEQVSSRAIQVDKKLDKEATRAWKQWKKWEARVKRKLEKKDTVAASLLFKNTEAFTQSIERLPAGTVQYISSLDTMLSSLKFMQQNTALVQGAGDIQKKLKEALGNVNGLQTSLQKAEMVKRFLKERKQLLKEQLEKLGFGKYLKKLNKQFYYYSQQLAEYKTLLNDHKKAERKALELLSKTKLFKDFMKKNSQLAALFRFPGEDLPQSPSGGGGLAGLQTRTQVNNFIQQQLGAGGPNAQQQFQQNIQAAQSQLSELKNKMIQLGDGSNIEMPEGFKPNNQKTKSFLQRLELGTNIQSQKANGYFPVTTDIGLSLGYKLNDQSIIGIGASYKMGWGKDIRHITITHQGMGLRSFIDWKIKGSFWITGGYEQNYKPSLLSLPGSQSALQESGLVGLSKSISLKTKFFKKTKLQLLWDFLSYQQIPRTQPVLFRVGYSF